MKSANEFVCRKTPRPLEPLSAGEKDVRYPGVLLKDDWHFVPGRIFLRQITVWQNVPLFRAMKSGLVYLPENKGVSFASA